MQNMAEKAGIPSDRVVTRYVMPPRPSRLWTVTGWVWRIGVTATLAWLTWKGLK